MSKDKKNVTEIKPLENHAGSEPANAEIKPLENHAGSEPTEVTTQENHAGSEKA